MENQPAKIWRTFFFSAVRKAAIHYTKNEVFPDNESCVHLEEF